jgi:predicted Zn-dependent protease
MVKPGAAAAPRMIRGSVVTHRRRCGKPNCRCTAGELHEAVVLSYSERGRTRFLMLPASEVAAVRAAAERYRAAEAKLQATGEAGRAALARRLAARRGRR